MQDRTLPRPTTFQMCPGELVKRGDFTDLPEVGDGVSEGSLCGDVSWLPGVVVKLGVEMGKTNRSDLKKKNYWFRDSARFETGEG